MSWLKRISDSQWVCMCKYYVLNKLSWKYLPLWECGYDWWELSDVHKLHLLRKLQFFNGCLFSALLKLCPGKYNSKKADVYFAALIYYFMCLFYTPSYYHKTKVAPGHEKRHYSKIKCSTAVIRQKHTKGTYLQGEAHFIFDLGKCWGVYSIVFFCIL